MNLNPSFVISLSWATTLFSFNLALLYATWQVAADPYLERGKMGINGLNAPLPLGCLRPVPSDLHGLKKDADEARKTVRKLLMEGFRFDPDSAAGLRK